MSPSLEPIAHQRLRQAVERAVTAGNGREVVELLGERTSLTGFGHAGVGGLEVLSGGFAGGISAANRLPFATFCLKVDEPEVLRAVLLSGLSSPEDLLRRVCTMRHAEPAPTAPDSDLGVPKQSPRTLPKTRANRLVTTHRDFWGICFELNSADGVRIGLEFDASNPRLTECGPKTPDGDYCTLHAQALDRALGHLAARNYWGAKNARFVCQVFLATKKPVSGVGAANFALDAFVTADVDADFAVELKELLDLYTQAGYIEPDRRLTGHAANHNFEGMLPLTGAVLSGSRVLALGLVNLGADTMGVGADVGRPELGAVDLARMGGPRVADRNSVVAAQARADAEAFASELAEAVMARTIARAPDACDASVGLAPRRRRAGV